jgi:hypothetical protein
MQGFPMHSHTHKELGQTFTDFANDIGIPDALHSDLRDDRSAYCFHERGLPVEMPLHEFRKWMAITECSLLRRKSPASKAPWCKVCMVKKVYKRMWDYGIVYQADMLSRITCGPNMWPGLEAILLGQMIDISKWLDFKFYNLIWYLDGPKGANTNFSVCGWKQALNLVLLPHPPSPCGSFYFIS